jgi:hypothetical protein
MEKVLGRKVPKQSATNIARILARISAIIFPAVSEFLVSSLVMESPSGPLQFMHGFNTVILRTQLFRDSSRES